MMSLDKMMREAGARLLKNKGYDVLDIASGSGVPKMSRLDIQKQGGPSLACSVKVSRGGRISYTRTSEGNYKVLSDVDRVLHVTPVGEDNEVLRITMFEAEAVEQAFEANFQALKKNGNAHLPLWVNPEFEDSDRLIGSGFMRLALWSEDVKANALILAEPKLPLVPKSRDMKRTGIMDEVRLLLAQHMGVEPSQLEIDVRIST